MGETMGESRGLFDFVQNMNSYYEKVIFKLQK